ncbi:hypothetical protein A7D25_06695 [Pseudomonas sp. 21C1]|nr:MULTISPECIES: HAD hydrolase family protein [Pseudomonas]OEC35865.1 hypothetical protein A7D25_06695 [Pseudomonas sp. 21C1]
MGKPYHAELDAIHATYSWATQQDVLRLHRYLSRWTGEYACFIGSGGSYSAAFAAAELREIAHGSPTRALTPMELSAKARFTPASKVMLLSAEGRNPDVLAAATYAMQSDMTCAALTLTKDNPLTRRAIENRATRIFSYEMPWGKDGYLATNSLIATVLLLHRALFPEGTGSEFLAQLFDAEVLLRYRNQWRANTTIKTMGGRNFIVLHDPMTKSFAIDLESKLSESAVAKVEIADYRQFAHGRHLQLADGAAGTAVIVAFSRDSKDLAEATLGLFPSDVLTFKLEIPGEEPNELVVAGLVMATLLTETIASTVDRDPGQPTVPTFGREIYRLDSSQHFRGWVQSENRYSLAARRKFDHRNVSADEMDTAENAAEVYEGKLQAAVYKAIISDFDGTLCNAEDRYSGMCPHIAKRILQLIDDGLIFSIASGRGGSLRKDLVKALPPEYHKAIWVGYYGGSLIQPLDEEVEHPPPNPVFEDLLGWLKTTAYYPRLENSRKSRGGQLTITVSSPEESRKLRLALRTRLNAGGLGNWKVFCSGHSIDVLDGDTSKNKVVKAIGEKFGFDPLTQVLRLGDSGDEEGNDYDLLSQGCSLSADRVSASLTSCWNFASPGSSQAGATQQYLDYLQKTDEGFGLRF